MIQRSAPSRLGLSAFILVTLSSCYRSSEWIDPAAGTYVTVVGLRSFYGFARLGETAPVAGARVIAQRCGDVEFVEAVTEADGRALVPLDDVDCWTVTAVHPSLPLAVTHVEVDPEYDEVLTLSSDGAPAPTSSFPLSKTTLSIVGRQRGGSNVSLFGDALLFGTPTFASPFPSTNDDSIFVYTVDPEAPNPRRIFGVEYDDNLLPLGFGTVEFDQERAMLELDVSNGSRIFGSRDVYVELPAEGAIDISALEPGRVTIDRERPLAQPIFGIGTGEFVSTTTLDGVLAHKITTRALVADFESLGFADESAEIVFGDHATLGLSVFLPQGLDRVRIPRLDEASVNVEDLETISIAVGGSECAGHLTIYWNREGGDAAIWLIKGREGSVLRLDALPRLPRSRGLRALGLDGHRAALFVVDAHGRVGSGRDSQAFARWRLTVASSYLRP